MRISQSLMAVTVAIFGFSQNVSAEGSFSSSNNLDDDVNVQIVTMLGLEISTLRRAPADRLSELANAAPKRVKRGWFFGRRNTGSVDNFKYSAASLALRPTARGGTQWKCLSEALYFEARGESVRGQFAVAEVILNRVDERSFPNSACKVVRQGTGRGKYACQFSYNCDGKAENFDDLRAYKQVSKVARIMLDGEPRILTKGATYYHAVSVSPKWAPKFTQTAVIGVHKFYRDTRRFSSN